MSDIDWERIESDYRAGILSLREIADMHPPVNHVAITRRAKKEGWVRNLSARIQAKAEELVTRQAVTDDVTDKRRVTDREIVEANAANAAAVQVGQRREIKRAKELSIKLLSEIESVTDDPTLFAELGEFLRSDEDGASDKRMQVFNAVLSMPGRVDALKKLSDTLKTLILLERQAYNLDADTKADSGLDDLSKRIEAARRRAK